MMRSPLRHRRRQQHPTGIPLVYELDEEALKPSRGGTCLDRAEAKIAAVANQGKYELSEKSPESSAWTRPGLRRS